MDKETLEEIKALRFAIVELNSTLNRVATELFEFNNKNK
jgi:hypothetical protein